MSVEDRDWRRSWLPVDSCRAHEGDRTVKRQLPERLIYSRPDQIRCYIVTAQNKLMISQQFMDSQTMEEKETSSHHSFATRSKVSASSKCFNRSSSSSVAAIRARAEAEAAKAKLEFAEKEMEMKMAMAQLDAEKACLDACLDVLDVRRSAAVALAKAEALAAILEDDKETSCKLGSLLENQSHDSSQRVVEYIQKQAELQARHLTPELQHMDLAPTENLVQSGPCTDKVPSTIVDLSHQHMPSVKREESDIKVSAAKLSSDKQQPSKKWLVTVSKAFAPSQVIFIALLLIRTSTQIHSSGPISIILTNMKTLTYMHSLLMQLHNR